MTTFASSCSFWLSIRPRGATVAGTGGVRKIRVGLQGPGKRGGARLIYYYLQRDEVIYLLFVYPKNQQESLTAEQKKLMKALVDQLEGKE